MYSRLKYVLLAAGHSAVMREAQAQGAGAIAGTAFASAVDLGAAAHEFLVPGHPPRKQEVVRRISLAVRALVCHAASNYACCRVAGRVSKETELPTSLSRHSFESLQAS